MNKEEIQEIIDTYSDYGMPNPYWINLNFFENMLRDNNCENIEKIIEELKKAYLGEEINELLQYETAYKYSLIMIFKTRKLLKCIKKKYSYFELIEYLIDGGWSRETDCREIDLATGMTLHACPTNDSSVIEELKFLLKLKRLTLCDWRWLDMVINSFKKNENKKMYKIIEKIIKKF